MDEATQEMIPGTELVKDAHLHALAQKYAKLRDARLNLGRDEGKAKQQLIDAMNEKGETVYEFGTVCVYLDSTDNVKVTIDDGEKKKTDE